MYNLNTDVGFYFISVVESHPLHTDTCMFTTVNDIQPTVNNSQPTQEANRP